VVHPIRLEGVMNSIFESRQKVFIKEILAFFPAKNRIVSIPNLTVRLSPPTAETAAKACYNAQ
jgi:hypothetical protein